jgi:hypothetical protein
MDLDLLLVAMDVMVMREQFSLLMIATYVEAMENPHTHLLMTK